MIKLPKSIKIIILLFLIALLYCLLVLINTIFKENKSDGYYLSFTELQFYVSFGFVVIISFFFGIMAVSVLIQAAWTTEDFIERQENPITINKLILGLYQKKHDLFVRNPELKKIPDSIKVIITHGEIIDTCKKK